MTFGIQKKTTMRVVDYWTGKEIKVFNTRAESEVTSWCRWMGFHYGWVDCDTIEVYNYKNECGMYRVIDVDTGEILIVEDYFDHCERWIMESGYAYASEATAIEWGNKDNELYVTMEGR